MAVYDPFIDASESGKLRWWNAVDGTPRDMFADASDGGKLKIDSSPVGEPFIDASDGGKLKFATISVCGDWWSSDAVILSVTFNPSHNAFYEFDHTDGSGDRHYFLVCVFVNTPETAISPRDFSCETFPLPFEFVWTTSSSPIYPSKVILHNDCTITVDHFLLGETGGNWNVVKYSLSEALINPLTFSVSLDCFDSYTVIARHLNMSFSFSFAGSNSPDDCPVAIPFSDFRSVTIYFANK